MPHVNQLIDEFGKDGFFVVGVTSEGQSDTRKFMEKTEAKWIVAYDSKAMSQYGFEGYPSAALVDPSGTVVWKGHPGSLTAATIKPLLLKVRSNLDLPSKYASIVSAYDKDKFSEAFKKIETELQKPNLSEADKAALELARTSIENLASGDLGEGSKLEEKKDFFQALEAYDRVAQQYAGLEQAQKASEAAARIRGDDALKPELEGGKKIAEADKKMQAKSYQAAWKILSGVIKSFPETAAAERAKAVQEKMKADLLYGFNPNCKDCKKEGTACVDCRSRAKW